MSTSSYENSAFPLATGSSFNHYGQRGSEDGVVSGGQVHGSGVQHEKVVYITGNDFDGTTSFDTQLIIPAGAVNIDCTFEVSEAFTTGNADNVFNVGTNGTESTNGYTLAEPDTVVVEKDITPAGTWASPLTADTAVGVSVTGTTATVTGGIGKCKVVLRYTKI